MKLIKMKQFVRLSPSISPLEVSCHHNFSKSRINNNLMYWSKIPSPLGIELAPLLMIGVQIIIPYARVHGVRSKLNKLGTAWNL